MGPEGLLAGQLEAPKRWGERFQWTWDEEEVCGHQAGIAISQESSKVFQQREARELGEGVL